ncbi:MAG: transglutaminase domain-containing protein [Patescibacteria group bacterium]
MSNPELSRHPEQPEIASFDAKDAFRQAKNAAIGQALQSREGIAGLRSWQSLGKRSKSARTAKHVFETLGAYDRSVRASPENTEALQAEVMAQTEPTGLEPNRVNELLSCFRAKQLGQPMPKVRPEVERIFTRIVKSQSTEGEVDVSELMASGNISYGSKFQWFESRLAGALDWLESRDTEEARAKAQEPPPPEVMKQKQEQPDLNVPPPQEDTLTPSMEEMERSKENEPGAYFTVRPFYGGYYRGDDFDTWNNRAMRWEKSASSLADVEETSLDAKTRKTVAGTIHGGKRTILPMPYGYAPDVQTIRTHGGEVLPVKSDGHGSFIIDASKQRGLISFSAEIGKNTTPVLEVAPSAPQPGTEVLSPETQRKLEEIVRSNQSALDKARALKAFVRSTLKYSNDSSFNAVYRSGDPNEYFSRIEQHRQADCDVANTYFVALLRRIGIPSCLVSGHYVKVKDKQNATVMSSGTAHAWAEAWDGQRWQRLDATPPGDPNMDVQETDEEKSDDAFEGDFGEQEAEVLSDEQLEKLMADAERALEQKERAPEELAALRFAAEADCTPEEAKVIMRKISEAREKRDNQGRNIRSRLLAEWQKVIQDNLVNRIRYTAPIRLSRGQELVDPVETVLDMAAGEADPSGFSKYERKVEREQIYGGFDAFLTVDKSGSMSETDPSSGRPKWEDQQTFVFLMMDSMYGAAQEFKRQKIKLISPLDLRVALVSFQGGSGKVELPLGTSWGPKEQARVWRSLQENVGGGTPDHLGLQTVRRMIQEDASEHTSGKERLRLVLVSADGGSDNPATTIAAKESLKSLGAIVKAGGIGSGARQVVSTYAPDGTNLESFGDAPDWAAKEVIGQAKKLYPKKIRGKP